MGGILNLALILNLVLISFCPWESWGPEGLGHWARITQPTSGGIRIPIQAVLGPYQLQFSTFLRHNGAMRILEIIHVKHWTHWCSVSTEWRSVMIIVYYCSYCVIISYCVFHRKKDFRRARPLSLLLLTVSVFLSTKLGNKRFWNE